MATVSNTLQAAPDFSRLTPEDRHLQTDYETFFEWTNTENITSYANGASLTNLTSLADRILSAIERANPFWPQGEDRVDQPTAIRARQWQMDRLSDVKERLGQAVDQKRSYYENHWFGIVTQYFLKCFCMWNDSNTAAITTAEDFLLRYDSRYPVRRHSDVMQCVPYTGSYDQQYYFFFLTPFTWLQDNLDLTRFYNYNPPARVINVIPDRSLLLPESETRPPRGPTPLLNFMRV
ncbi:MAG: hypothetical protein AB7H48_01915 [Parachlamydiales bacterium]